MQLIFPFYGKEEAKLIVQTSRLTDTEKENLLKRIDELIGKYKQNKKEIKLPFKPVEAVKASTVEPGSVLGLLKRILLNEVSLVVSFLCCLYFLARVVINKEMEIVGRIFGESKFAKVLFGLVDLFVNY